MRLADQIAQSRFPFYVRDACSREVVRLNGVADHADQLLRCPTRYVLSDDLTRLCTALAYSRGARSLACADLLRVPAECVWVEWCEAPWQEELERYGLRCGDESAAISGRRGALIRSSPQGRRGQIRTFWSAGPTDGSGGRSELDVVASSMEAFFDFDTPEGEAPDPPDGEAAPAITVFDQELRRADVLRRCFRFRFERTWADYYARAGLSPGQMDAIARHALGTIAIDVPVLLTFLVLLMSRPGIPRRPLMLERLNRARGKAGKRPLLPHVEVFSPLSPDYLPSLDAGSGCGRRPPRLHHVRGHLVRRGSQISWRVPHLRGSARAGLVRSRTVTWTIDTPSAITLT
ncbi:MAG TPA: hypothetical protein VME42_12105 [Steroidobacteraceae bacterium]|nr:hypothetical protein [Steroidobacteraceae bacterium]